MYVVHVTHVYVTIDSFVVVIYHQYCCCNFLDRCEQHDCDGTIIDLMIVIDDGDGFDIVMDGDEL